MGNSLSPGPDIICYFISLDDVSCAESVDPEGKDWRTKCDFVVKIVPKLTKENISTTDGEEHSSANDNLKSIRPDYQLSQRSNGPQTSFNIVREGLQYAFKRIKLSGSHDSSGTLQFEPRPYYGSLRQGTAAGICARAAAAGTGGAVRCGAVLGPCAATTATWFRSGRTVS